MGDQRGFRGRGPGGGSGTRILPLLEPLLGRAVPAAVAALAALSPPATAQLVSPSLDLLEAAAGGPHVAGVRDVAATAGNPAALGAPGSAPWSVVPLQAGAEVGLGPVGTGDLARWEDRDVPRAVREAWLAEVRESRGQDGQVGARVGVAATRGAVGVSAGVRGRGGMELNADAMELLLFGNAGLDGTPRDFRLQGSEARGAVASHLRTGVGLPLGRVGEGELRVGAAVELTLGHAAGAGRDAGSALDDDPATFDLRFPVLYTDRAGLDRGRGWGVDLGLHWARGGVEVGAVLHRAVSTFAWEVDEMVFRPGAALFDAESSDSDFDPRPGPEAPPALRDAVEALELPPVLAVGAAWAARPDLHLRGTVRHGWEDGLDGDGGTEVALGARGRTAGVPVAGGLLLRTDAVVVRGGVAGRLGGVTLTGALTARAGGEGGALGGGVGLRLGVGPRPPSTRAP